MDSMDFKPLSEKNRAKMLEIIKSRLDEVDANRLRQAMLSMDWLLILYV